MLKLDPVIVCPVLFAPAKAVTGAGDYAKVVLRGFSAVSDFLKDKERDFKLAKQAFIASFITKLKDKVFPEAIRVIEAAESLCAKLMGWSWLASS